MKKCLLRCGAVFSPFPDAVPSISFAGYFFALKNTVVEFFKRSVNFYQTKRSYIPEDFHQNAVRTSHLTNYKQTSARCYSFYSKWWKCRIWRCRISLHILSLLCTYLHEFAQYFSDNYSVISRIFHFFASAHSG